MLVRSLIIAFTIARVGAQSISGEAIYQEHCASCHDVSALRTPRKEDLQKLAVANILRELESGVMSPIARDLKPPEREAVARYLGVGPGAEPSAKVFCAQRTVAIPTAPKSLWNGWSPQPTNTHFQTAEAAGLTIEQTRNLRLKWAFGFEGDQIVFAQPSIVGDNLFVGSNSGKVHALDRQSGCTRWTFQADTGVRSAIAMVPLGTGGPEQKHALLFGDRAGSFYSLEAESGRLLWKKKVDDHEAARITGAAVVNDGVVYIPVASVEETLARRDFYLCCSFRGSVVALGLEDGSRVWKTYTITEAVHTTIVGGPGDSVTVGPRGPSGVAVWSTPTLDLKRSRLYIGTGNNYSEPATNMSDSILALDLKTGRILWHQQTLPGDILNGNCQAKDNCPGPDYDFGASPILVRTETGRDLLLAGQKSGVVYALDPDNDGRIVWQARVGKGGVNGGVQWGMASDGKNVYAATSDVVRRGAAGYDPKQGGGLTALRINDGAKVWYVEPPPCDDKKGCSPAQSAAVTVIPGVVFSGSLDGHLRAYATEDGKILWDFDTARPFPTVNGVKASGGGVDGPGAVVADHMVFVGSGYARTGGMGGNVLLAFSAE